MSMFSTAFMWEAIFVNGVQGVLAPLETYLLCKRLSAVFLFRNNDYALILTLTGTLFAVLPVSGITRRGRLRVGGFF